MLHALAAEGMGSDDLAALDAALVAPLRAVNTRAMQAAADAWRREVFGGG